MAPKQKAPKTPLLTSLDACDSALAEIKQIDRDIAVKSAPKQKKIDELTEELKEIVTPLQQRRDYLAKSVEEYCVANRNAILEPNKKSRKLTYGSIFFRTCPPSVKPVKKWTFAAIVKAIQATLSEALQERFIRCKDPELDKEAVLAYHNQLKNAETGSDIERIDLASVGIEVITDKEEFYFELAETVAADLSENKAA